LKGVRDAYRGAKELVTAISVIPREGVERSRNLVYLRRAKI
jgi:hypothetical protein